MNDSRLTDPVAVTASSSASIGNSALDMRHDLGALGSSARGGNYGFDTGVFPGGTANGQGLSSDDLQVSPGGGMTVSVSPGAYQVDRGSFGPYIGALTGSYSVTIPTANASNPRYDYVVLRVRDPGVDASVTLSANILVLQGTASASPSEPTGQLTSGDVLLAAVLVNTNVTSISAGNISDRRLFVTARGGIYPKSAVDSRDGAYTGQLRSNLANLTIEGWDGSSWIPFASLTGWRTYSPFLYYGGDGFAGGSTQCNLGSGAIYSGRYQQIGKRLDLIVVVKWGTAPFNAGSGPINAYLPTGFFARSGGNTEVQQFYANLYTAGVAGSYNASSWTGQAGVRPGTNVIGLAFTMSAADCRLAAYRVASTAGTAGTGVPLVPGGFPEGGILSFSMMLEIQ